MSPSRDFTAEDPDPALRSAGPQPPKNRAPGDAGSGSV
ncbi:hypothetical protein ASZ90_009061 [hydrocarbon metagenome]|uniref:Uncharacterized protein n=1 Tax=hydrocarbon metagenome TaxID=938273 RepID=A0A0W8FJZ7_9ZZZZ